MKKRLLSILLTACLLAGLLPTAALAAEGDVEYLYCDANGANWQTGTITAREYIVVESGITTWAGGWYVVNSNVDISSRVTVMGNVHLILTDGCTLTVNGGIQVTGSNSPFGGNSLTIYGQENGTGTLIATGVNGAAGIGGSIDGDAGIGGGNVTINGGTVNATGGGSYAAGIGGGGSNIYSGGDGGTVTINDGTVNAAGGVYAAGIGGGGSDIYSGGDGGTVTINGGTVNATSDGYAAGIGGGGSIRSGGDGGTVTINGGTVTATGGRGNAGIGGGGYAAGGGGIGGGSGSFRTQEAGEAKGSAMIFASSISDRSDEANWSGIIFPNLGWGLEVSHNGKVYGNPTLPADLILRENYTLTIPAGASLTVPGGKTLSIRSGATLTNNGTLYCAGDTVNNGTLTNNGTIYVDGNLNGTVSGDGVMYYLLTLKDCKVDAANTAEANTSTVNGKTFGKVGGTIYFAATPSANQLVTGWDVTKGVIKQETTDHSSCWISSMPAEPVTVKANFATALTVTQQPTGGTIDYGGSVTLSVTVSKHSALDGNGFFVGYQWYLDGDPVDTTLVSSYSTPTDLAAGDHTYTCKITYHANMRSYTVTSAPATVTVNPLAETAPKISIDYQNETLTGFVSGSKYAIDGTAVTTDGGKLSVVDYIGHNISIVTKAGDSNHKDSAAQTLTVPTRPEAPSSYECTIDYIKETISFDSSKYEVNTVADFTGIAVECNRHVTPGTTLYVRKKAVAETSFASEATRVTIPARPEKPTVAIDYTAETLSTTTAMEYKVNGGAWMPCTADMAATAFGWNGTVAVEVQFRTKATKFEYASEAQTATIPARPDRPSLSAVNETVDGKNDGQITGLTAGTVYEISSDNGANWQDKTADTAGKITGLAPKAYKVRVKATDTDFAGAAATVDIVIGAAKTYTLNVTAPTFAEAAYGYEQPAAQAITITSSGNWDSTITKVTVDSTDFTIGGSGGTVAAGGTIDTWTVQPAVGLAAGTHTATITVTYNDGASATAQVSFTVTKAAQASPAVPTLDGSTVTISEADRGKALEYSLNGGGWTDVPTLDNGSFVLPGLAENTGCTIYLRVKASADGSYEASDAVGCFSVAYNANGGTGTVPCASASSGNAVTVASGAELQRDGYTFGGWNTEADGSGTAYETAGSSITTAATLYAQWTINRYTITFDTDGGTEIDPITLDYGDSVTAPENPTKTGYTFVGWDETIPNTMPAQNMTITARWTINQYTITLNPNYDGGESGTMTTGDGWNLTSLPTPTRSGYTFGGWFTAAEDGTEVTADTEFTENTTIYAHWTANSSGGSSGGSGGIPHPPVVEQPEEGGVTTTDKTKIFFVDISAGAYYETAVLWAAKNGITGGVSDTHFAPNAPCTRAQIVTFLWRAAGCPAPKIGGMPFTDVKTGDYYYHAVLWAVENGITTGTGDGTFSPNAACTRAQAMAFLYRSEQARGGGMQGAWMFLNPFDDVNLESYYGEAVMWAVANGVTSGTSDTTFSPDATCTRAQIVTFLYRCLGGK